MKNLSAVCVQAKVIVQSRVMILKPRIKALLKKTFSTQCMIYVAWGRGNVDLRDFSTLPL